MPPSTRFGQRPAGPGPNLQQAMAIHQAMLAAQLARAVANQQRYATQLRVAAATQQRADAATDRQARLDGRFGHRYVPIAAQRYAMQLRYAHSPAGLAALRPRPRVVVRQGMTAEQRLWAHVQATNSQEIAFMMYIDPTIRAVAATTGAVVAVEATTVVAAEEVTAYSAWRWLGWRAGLMRFGTNAAGQWAGNYALGGDSREALARINWVSPFLSAAGVPLMTSAVGSAGFKLSREKGYTSVLDGSISAPMAAQEAFISYGLGQTTRLSGLDNWHVSPMASGYKNGLRYQVSLRLSPRFAKGVGEAIPTVFEASNRTVVGAARKVGAAEIKKRLP